MRKLLLVTALAATSLALTAASASAWAPLPPNISLPSVVKDAGTGQPCGTVTVNGPNVSGGCVVPMSMPAWTLNPNYYSCGPVSMTVHVGSDGRFAARSVSSTSCNPGGIQFTRCDPNLSGTPQESVLYAPPWQGMFGRDIPTNNKYLNISICFTNPSVGSVIDRLGYAYVPNATPTGGMKWNWVNSYYGLQTATWTQGPSATNIAITW